MRHRSRCSRLLQRPLNHPLVAWRVRILFLPLSSSHSQVHADAPEPSRSGASAFFNQCVAPARSPGAKATVRRLFSQSASGNERAWRGSLAAKGHLRCKMRPHTQHKLPDFSTSIRFSKVDNLFGALFPGVFPKKSGLYWTRPENWCSRHPGRRPKGRGRSLES